YDPLDGSANIDVNVSIGTIFSIHKRLTKRNGTAGLADCLQVGKKQVAAGYILYGSSTMLVYTTGQGAHGFTLDPTIGEFLLSHPNITTPPGGRSILDIVPEDLHQKTPLVIGSRDDVAFAARVIGAETAVPAK